MAFFVKYKKSIIGFIFYFFFISLVFLPNSINSKVIVALAIISLLSIDFNALKRSARNNYPILLVFLWLSFSLSYSSDILNGIKEIGGFIIIPISVLIFSQVKLDPKTVYRILYFFVGCMFIAALYSHSVKLADFFINGEASFRSFFNLHYSYMELAKTINLHPTYYAYYLLTAIAILLDFFKNKRNNWAIALAVFLIVYFSFFIVHLSSRIGIVGLYLMLMCFFMSYFFNGGCSRKIKGFLGLGLFHFLIGFFVLNVGTTKYRFQHLFGFSYYDGYTVNDGDHKIRLWSAALKSNKSIFFGNGIGDVGQSLNEQYLLDGLSKPHQESYNSHNQYIEFYVASGAIGVLLLLYCFYFYAKKFYGSGKITIGWYFIAFTSFLCLTECMFNRHHGLVYFCVMLGLFLAIGANDAVSDLKDANNNNIKRKLV